MENNTYETPNAFLCRKIRELNATLSRLKEEKDAIDEQYAALQSSCYVIAQAYSELKAKLADEIIPLLPEAEIVEADEEITITEPLFTNFDGDVVAIQQNATHRTNARNTSAKHCRTINHTTYNHFPNESPPKAPCELTRRPPPCLCPQCMFKSFGCKTMDVHIIWT